MRWTNFVRVDDCVANVLRTSFRTEVEHLAAPICSADDGRRISMEMSSSLTLDHDSISFLTGQSAGSCILPGLLVLRLRGLYAGKGKGGWQ